MERSVLCMELMAREEAVEGLSEASIHAQVEAKILQHTPYAAQLKSLEDNCLELQREMEHLASVAASQAFGALRCRTCDYDRARVG